jgi:hypothetical protein
MTHENYYSSNVQSEQRTDEKAENKRRMGGKYLSIKNNGVLKSS